MLPERQAPQWHTLTVTQTGLQTMRQWDRSLVLMETKRKAGTSTQIAGVVHKSSSVLHNEQKFHLLFY